MENENKFKNKNVETYTRDMVKAIENDKGGLIKKIIHEEEEHEAQKKNLSPGSKKNRIFMFISVALIFIALAALFFLIFLNKKIGTVSIVPQMTSIIFTDKSDFKAIDGLNKDKIEQTVLNQVNDTGTKIGGIDGIYLTENKETVGFKEFIKIIKGSLIADQTSLISDNFLLGAYVSGIKQTSPSAGDFFILLNVRSFSDIFPVMQAWENKMLYDLGGFFGIEITPNTNYLFTKNFEDGIVANKNARILYDNNGGIVLMYIFADDNFIIISNSELATQEVILRLNSSKIKK
ncbi:MAG: hypothetical protein WC447_02790 [Candidatus Paceibacterota bacterium]